MECGVADVGVADEDNWGRPGCCKRSWWSKYLLCLGCGIIRYRGSVFIDSWSCASSNVMVVRKNLNWSSKYITHSKKICHTWTDNHLIESDHRCHDIPNRIATAHRVSRRGR